jgi:steroid delta-isomerase-like uncharacterized protein
VSSVTTPEQNKELVRRFNEEVFNKKNLAFLESALADDFVEHEETPGIDARDKSGAIQWFKQMFEAIPDAHGEITHIVASGDRVAVRTVMSGTDEGGFMPGMPATGKSFETTAIDILRFDDDGKVAEHWGLFDAMTAMMQLGLVPAAPGS